jgi:sensor histidine kinase regulating citrate/malate metabolism
MQYYKEKIDKELLQQQNDAYMQQMNIIKQSQENLSILKHDFKFHIASLQTLIEKQDIEKALNYLRSSFEALNTKGEFARSGNQEVDSILNYKINEALNRNIEIELSLSIPDKLKIAPFDLVAILGNLFDNAIVATSKLGSNRKITIDIRYDRNLLFISFTNPFSEIIIENQKLYTTHQNKQNHGFGIESVKKAVEKYNGTLEFRSLNNIFYIDALLYNPID